MLLRAMLLPLGIRQRAKQRCCCSAEGNGFLIRQRLRASRRLALAISQGEMVAWPLDGLSSRTSTEPHCSCVSSVGAARERWMGSVTQTQLALACPCYQLAQVSALTPCLEKAVYDIVGNIWLGGLWNELIHISSFNTCCTSRSSCY